MTAHPPQPYWRTYQAALGAVVGFGMFYAIPRVMEIWL